MSNEKRKVGNHWFRHTFDDIAFSEKTTFARQNVSCSRKEAKANNEITVSALSLIDE